MRWVTGERAENDDDKINSEHEDLVSDLLALAKEEIEHFEPLVIIFLSPKVSYLKFFAAFVIFHRCLWLSVWDKSLTGAEVSSHPISASSSA